MSVKTWIGGNGDWSNPANWSDLSVPVPGDLVIDQSGQILVNNLALSDTIWLNSVPGSAVGLTLNGTLLGVSSTVVSNAYSGPIGLYFANSALQGVLLASIGTTVVTVAANTAATNAGTMTTSGNTGPAAISIIDNPGGVLQNLGVIETAINGSISVAFGTDPATLQSIANQGTMEADAGGLLTIASGVFGATTSGEVMNSGLIKANAGTVIIDTAIDQATTGQLAIAYDGVMTVAGAVDGGTVTIQSGMLQFAASPSFASPGPLAASLFDAGVAFTGTTGAIGFGDTPIAEVFNAAANQVIVTVAGSSTRIATIQLETNRTYSAGDFSVSGSTLQYLHPATP